MSEQPTPQTDGGEAKPAQEPDPAPPTEQLDALADASDRERGGTSGTSGASADGSLSRFVIGLLAASGLVVAVAIAIELSVG